MAKYSLYETIKDKLNPRVQKRLEDTMRYRRLTNTHINHSENNIELSDEVLKQGKEN